MGVALLFAMPAQSVLTSAAVLAVALALALRAVDAPAWPENQ